MYGGWSCATNESFVSPSEAPRAALTCVKRKKREAFLVPGFMRDRQILIQRTPRHPAPGTRQIQASPNQQLSHAFRDTDLSAVGYML